MPDGPPQPKTPLDIAEQIANINEKNATAQHKRAHADSLEHKALVSPLQLLAEHSQRNADRFVTSVEQIANRKVDFLHRLADRDLDHFHRSADRESRERVARQQAARQSAAE
jgi:hypothetical protein